MGVTESKTCPICQKAWAISFRFCPDDGTPLLVVRTHPEPATDPGAGTRPKGRKPSGRFIDMVPISDADLDQASLSKKDPGPPTRDRARPAPPPPGPTPDGRPQRLIKGGAAAARSTRTRDAQTERTLADFPPPKALRELRNAPTLLVTPAITPEQAAKAARSQKSDDAESGAARDGAKAAIPRNPKTAPEIQAAAPAPEKRGGKRKATGGFSETDWFLAPIDANLVDEASGKVTIDPSRYIRNPSIPEDKRRRFSLGSDDEE